MFFTRADGTSSFNAIFFMLTLDQRQIWTIPKISFLSSPLRSSTIICRYFWRSPFVRSLGWPVYQRHLRPPVGPPLRKINNRLKYADVWHFLFVYHAAIFLANFASANNSLQVMKTIFIRSLKAFSPAVWRFNTPSSAISAALVILAKSSVDLLDLVQHF